MPAGVPHTYRVSAEPSRYLIFLTPRIDRLIARLHDPTSGRVTNMNTFVVPAGSWLTVDIDQVGSTVAGSDLTVQVELS